MLIVAGIDIGAATTKAVILGDDKVLSLSIIATGFSVTRAAEMVIEQVLNKLGLPLDRVEYVISTGYGRRAVPFAHKTLTEITCHAAGAHFLKTQVRTVIDVGGQDSKVIRLDQAGGVVNFVMNDKCAAGTGRFLEVMAGVLDIPISEMGTTSLMSNEPCSITSTCTVFAESEMVSLRAEGKKRDDIIAGIHRAMAHRISIMAQSVGFERDAMFTGGVAKNIGMKKALEDEIGIEIIVPEEPQIIGALGAALLARAELVKLRKTTLKKFNGLDEVD